MPPLAPPRPAPPRPAPPRLAPPRPAPPRPPRPAPPLAIRVGRVPLRDRRLGATRCGRSDEARRHHSPRPAPPLPSPPRPAPPRLWLYVLVVSHYEIAGLALLAVVVRMKHGATTRQYLRVIGIDHNTPLLRFALQILALLAVFKLAISIAGSCGIINAKVLWLRLVSRHTTLCAENAMYFLLRFT